MKRTINILAVALAALSIVQCRKENDKLMTVEISPSSVTLAYGGSEKVSYAISNASGSVSVEVQGVPDDIKRTFSCLETSGSITFTSAYDKEEDIAAKVVFKDSRTSVTKDLTVKTTAKEHKAPVIEANPDSRIIYPEGSGLAVTIPFTVTSEDEVTGISLLAGAGLSMKFELASDKKSGTITVTADDELGVSSDIKITATNKGGESTCTVTLEKAYVNVSSERFDIEAGGDISGKTLTVTSNLATTIAVDDKEDFIDANVSGSSVKFTVKANSTFTPRTAAITVSEPQGKLDKVVYICQSGAEGSLESDRAALIALYDALNMKEWTDYGCFSHKEYGEYYKNWCTDIPLDGWLGVKTTKADGLGRVYSIELVGKQPNCTGYIPEELGNLTELRDIEFYPWDKITHVPESIKNLVKLESLHIYGEMDMDISEWTGLAELANNPANKLDVISFCNTGLHGTIPEWVKNINNGIGIAHCHFSGQIPDCVVNSPIFEKESSWYVEDLDACPRFDASTHTKTGDGWYYYITVAEEWIYLQDDNYALWVGERPENTKWVDDKFGGHWEWTD